MTRPIPPLGTRPLTRQAQAKLNADLRRAIGVARWAGCCRLCGRLISRANRGTSRRHETPYGAICGICHRAPLDTLEAGDFLAEWDDVEYLAGRAPRVDEVLARLYPEDGDVATIPEQTEEEIGHEMDGYRRAVRNALASAVWAVHSLLHTPPPPPPYEQPADYLIDYLACYLAAAEGAEEIKTMTAVIEDRLYAHLPGSVIHSIMRDLADEAAKRRRGYV